MSLPMILHRLRHPDQQCNNCDYHYERLLNNNYFSVIRIAFGFRIGHIVFVVPQSGTSGGYWILGRDTWKDTEKSIK